jgi:hypothetical protein
MVYSSGRAVNARRRRRTIAIVPNPAVNNSQVVGSGAGETVPAAENRTGLALAYELQAASAQVPSVTIPILPPLMSTIPPTSVNPSRGKPFDELKKNAIARSPD